MRRRLSSVALTLYSRKVVFVDTDALPARETQSGHLVQNPTEVALVDALIRALLSCGVPSSSLGVIALYRQQIKLLTATLPAGIETLTADRSQGRDKDCVIMSLTRSNDRGAVGDLVRDWRRLNVCFSRAQSKLVIFGSRSTLDGVGVDMLNRFFKLVDERGWTYALPGDALTRHGAGLKRASSQAGPSSSQQDGIKRRKFAAGPTSIRGVLADVVANVVRSQG